MTFAINVKMGASDLDSVGVAVRRTIKIESHKRPDVWRQWSANPVALANVRAEEVNASPNYNSVNRNKRSLCLDLKDERGKAIFRRLAAEADIVMENYTPRVMDRFGLGYADLRGDNPKLVMTSFSGFGKTGPLSDYKANGASIEGIAGWDFLHRHRGQEPVIMGFYQADPISGLQMAAATLVALFQQRRTGLGQAVEGSMMEAAAGYIGEQLLAAQLGVEAMVVGNGDPDCIVSGVFPCVGGDEWIAICASDEDAWTGLISVVPGLSGFADAAERRAHRTKIETALAAWTASLTHEEAAEALLQARVAAAPVRTLGEVLACPHLESRQWFRPNNHADLGRHRYNGLAWRFQDWPTSVDLPPPRLGEHSREILAELGMNAAEIEDALRAGVSGEVLVRTIDSV